MKKTVTIVGARPQFIKAAMVSKAIAEHNLAGNEYIDERILHTGQHYDSCMSEIFFSQLNLPKPEWTLKGKAGESHGAMTGRMIADIETILMDENPDLVIVYGDTNSTLAGALTAAKLNIPVAHVEAGLRSFKREMPEEINRKLTDHLSSLLFCPTSDAVHNLISEGIEDGIHHSGDVMYDAALLFGDMAIKSSSIDANMNLGSRSFYLCTVHRAENAGSAARLASIVAALEAIGTEDSPVVFPVHPGTRLKLDEYGLTERLKRAHVRMSEPLSFFDMIKLENMATAILTDSGGIQKEAYFYHAPCITLRDETEWMETVDAGWNTLAGCDTDRIIAAVEALESVERSMPIPELREYGAGKAAQEIVKRL